MRVKVKSIQIDISLSLLQQKTKSLHPSLEALEEFAIKNMNSIDAKIDKLPTKEKIEVLS